MQIRVKLFVLNENAVPQNIYTYYIWIPASHLAVAWAHAKITQ